MTKEELDKLVKDTAATAVNAQLNTYLHDQLKEQFTDAVKQVKAEMKPDPVIQQAEEKAKAFRSFGDFLLSVWKARNRGISDERLTYILPVVTKDGRGEVFKTTGHMEIGDDAQGGFLVPEIYRATLYEHAIENEIVRPRATVLPMTTDSLKIPYVNDTSHVTSLFGGCIGYWTAEAGTKTASKPTWGQMELTPHKLAGLTYASNELLADSAISLEPLIRRMFSKTWAWFEDHAFLAGTGAGQPLGILNCGCLKSVFRNTVSHVYIEDIAEVYQSMLPTSLGSAYWIINPTVITELLQMGSASAAAASGRILVWQPDYKTGPTWTILGRPVLITEKVPELGTQGDIIFADLAYYLIGDRQPITIDASTHVAFTTDETAWRFVLRVAGQCWPQTTLTAHSATHTFSPFVALNAATS